VHQQFDISPEEGRRAKWPHEIFLINLIFNHIFVFCATVAVIGSFPYMPALVPIISFSIIGYIFIKARQIAARRNRFFMLLLIITCIISGGGLWLSRMMGWAKIPTIALLGGVGLLPFMVVLLVLIVLGNESVFMATNGKLPEHFADMNSDADEGINESPRKLHVKERS
jgi:hypothetical protein